jgi:hypothetical protein
MLECAAAEEKAFIQLFTGEAAMHKKVLALKIKTVTVGDFGHDVLLTFEDSRYGERIESVVKKPTPQPGWYFVQYEDGYISFSPADQFEKGNTYPKTFQDRVEVEKAELDEKISKLHTFLNTSVFADLDHEEQDRLNEQITAMESYSVILSDLFIAAF